MGRFGIKIVGLLLLISVGAFVISLVLVDDMLQASTATMRGYSKELEADLREVMQVYRMHVETKKGLFDLQSKVMAESPELTAAAWGRDREATGRALGRLLQGDAKAEHIAVYDEAERLVAEVGHAQGEGAQYRAALPIGATGWRLSVGFPIARPLQKRFESIGRKLDVESAHLHRINRALQPRYYPVFVRFFGIGMLIVTVIGLVFARRLASRVARLSQATRKVALGDLDVAVPTRSRDEIGQLSVAFNNMVGELRRNRAQIAYLQKISAWQEVARRLAHEIKNPLTPILLAMQQVQEKYPGDDPRYRKLVDDASEIVKEEVDGLRRLVEAFSAFAKLPSVQPEVVEVSDLFDDFLRSLGDLEEQGKVDSVSPSPGFRVMVDRLLFRRVLYNLVENAFQAGAGQGKTPRVEIRARRLARSRVGVITVTDNGPGIPESLRERVFDPYFTTKDSGTGLGLAIVKKIILEHHGSVDVEPAPGGGTRFTIRVPAI